MKFLLKIFFCAFAMPIVASSNELSCRSSTFKYYNEALSARLTANGVANKLISGSGVCVSVKDGAQIESADREVDNYFHEVAKALRDSCEERAFSEWATREKLRFDILDSTGSDRKPTGRKLFVLRSFSKEEVAVNQQRLTNESPKQAVCAKGKQG
jgi:hypothetical protein